MNSKRNLMVFNMMTNDLSVIFSHCCSG